MANDSLAIQSAKEEIRRQLQQAYALVSSAKTQCEMDCRAVAIVLLDMAEDVLSDLKYINRIDPPGEAAKGGAA